MKLYIVYDNVAEAHAGPVILYAADAAAMRAFKDAAADTRSEMHRHLEDYDLLKIGELIDLAGMPHIQATPAEIILQGKTLKTLTTTETNEKTGNREKNENEKIGNREKNENEKNGNREIDPKQLALLAD